MHARQQPEVITYRVRRLLMEDRGRQVIRCLVQRLAAWEGSDANATCAVVPGIEGMLTIRYQVSDQDRAVLIFEQGKVSCMKTFLDETTNECSIVCAPESSIFGHSHTKRAEGCPTSKALCCRQQW